MCLTAGELPLWDGGGWDGGLVKALLVGVSMGQSAAWGCLKILTEPRMSVQEGPLEDGQSSGSQTGFLGTLGFH